MRLKVFTSAMLLFSILLAVGWPLIVARHPGRQSSLPAKRAFVQTFLLYNAALVTSVVASGVGAILILRRARREYAEISRQNVRELVEGTLNDHRTDRNHG